MIIDCHTHLNRYVPEAPASLAERCAHLRSDLDANDVAYALVLSSYLATADRPGTEELLEVLADDPRIGLVAGIRYAAGPRAEIDALRAPLEQGRIKGFKLYPGYEPFYVHDPALNDVYEAAARFGIPVMIHTGDTLASGARVQFAHPLHVDEVAVRFPDVTFVLCHLGNPWFTDAMEVLYKNANVFADLSGLTLGAFKPRYERLMLRRVNEVLAYLHDPTKLLFGSDWPLSDVGSHLTFIRQLETTPDELEGILWRNSARVFGLPQRLVEEEGAQP